MARPDIKHIINSPAFASLYVPHKEAGSNPRSYWSAHEASTYTWPVDSTTGSLMRANEMKWDNIENYFARPLNQRDVTSDMLMAARNCRNYQEYRTVHGRIPPFMSASPRRLWLPLLHPDDCEMIAITSLNSGILDYHTGEPCMNYKYGIPVVMHQPGLLAHFKDAAFISLYCEVLMVQEERRKASLPDWIYCDEEEFTAISPVPISKKLKRNLEEYEAEGNKRSDLVPKSKALGPPPPKRQKVDKDANQRSANGYYTKPNNNHHHHHQQQDRLLQHHRPNTHLTSSVDRWVPPHPIVPPEGGRHKDRSPLRARQEIKKD